MANHRSIISLNLSVFVFMFGVGMIVSLLPQKIISLTGSIKTVGYLASAFAVSFVLLQLPIGRLSDRFGFRGFLLAGYLTCSASGLLYCFSNTQEMIFLGRMLQGIGEAPLWALGPALLSILYPEIKGKVIGLYNAAIHLGLTLGSVAGILISTIWVKNQPFLLFALAGLLGALFILMAVEDPKQTEATCDAPMDTGALKNLLTEPDTLAVFSGIILYGAGYGIFITVLPGFLIQDKGFTQTEVSWFFMLFYVAISLSQVTTGPLSDRHGRGKTMVWGLLAIFLGLGLFPAREGWKIYPWLFLASFGLGVFCVSALAWLNDAVDDSLKGTVSGAFYLFWGMGFFSGPLLLKSPATWVNGLTGFHLLALFYFFQAFLLGFTRHRHGKFYKDRI